MRIVVWGINYWPEKTGIGPCNTTLCEYLASRGHEVEMLTTFAYYPAWTKSSEDAGKLFRSDDLRGVKVRRCWHYVPSKVTTKKRILHELSFVLSSSLRLLGLKRPDVFVVVSPPLLLGFAAWVLGLVKRSPFFFHVQDLQPDAAMGLGMLKPGPLMRALYWLEAFAYRKAARVCGISQGMVRAFLKKGVAPDRVVYFPNPITFSANPPKGTFRAKFGFAETDFLPVYSGNLGAKQGLGVLVEAARLLRNERIKVIICGDGVQREELKAQAEGAPVVFLPLLEESEYRQMMVDADVCVITQAPGTGGVFFPSKLLSALAHSVPVFSVADEESELVRAVKEAGCGVNVLNAAPREVAHVLEELAIKGDELVEMGRRGREFAEQFEVERVLGRFEDDLRAVVSAAL